MGQVAVPARFPGSSSPPGSSGTCNQTVQGDALQCGHGTCMGGSSKTQLVPFQVGDISGGSYCKKQCLLCWLKL